MHHPYITAVLAAERHRDLVAAADRERAARRAASRGGLVRRWVATWTRAWDGVGVLQPGPRLQD